MNATGSPQHLWVSWPQRIGTAVVTSIGGIVVAGISEGEPIGIVLGLGLGVVLFLRGLRLGVTIDDRQVVVRNLFRTRTVLIGDADRFEFVTMWWAIRGPDEAVGLVTKDGRSYPITGLAVPSFSRMQQKSRERCVGMNRELKRRKRAARTSDL